VPCGHVTLVCAMHLRKAIVATDSSGIYDYVLPGVNGVLCKPSDPESMADEIRRLWADQAAIARLGENSQRYGAENCSEARIRSDLAAVLKDWQIPLLPEAIEVAAVPGR